MVDKVVAVHTSREVATFEPGHDALTELGDAAGLASLLDRHVLAWRGMWDRFRLDSDLDVGMVRILRLHLFHLLQTLSPNTASRDVGVPPRGLHGEAYRGLIMWDELFVLPMLDLRIPSLTRAMLSYRSPRLPAARRAARELGARGAMFPWQSAINGEEFAQEVHLNPESVCWVPDPTERQRHIGLAVAYNIRKYHGTTGDDAVLDEQGAEVLLEIARCFASSARPPLGGAHRPVGGHCPGARALGGDQPGAGRPVPRRGCQLLRFEVSFGCEHTYEDAR